MQLSVSSILDELLAPIALQEQQPGQVGVVDRRIGHRLQRRLGAIADAEPGAADHAEIVRAVADRERLLERSSPSRAAELEQRLLLCLGAEDRLGARSR